MLRDGEQGDLSRSTGAADLVDAARSGRLSDHEIDIALQRLLSEVNPGERLEPALAEAAVALLDNAPVLHAAIREVLFNPDDIADAMQETLLSVARSIHNYQGRSSLQTWAATIARRKAVDVLRRKHPDQVTETEVLDRVDETSRFSSQWATHADVAAALAGLSPKLREVFELIEGRGFGYEEVAAQLGVPRNTVASRLRRARAQLQLTIGPVN